MEGKLKKEIDPQVKKRRELLARNLKNASDRCNSKDFGPSLKIVAPLLQAFSTVATAQTLGAGTAPLMLSLKMVMQGIERESCAAGVIGRSFNRIEKSTVDLLIGLFFEKSNEGCKAFLKLACQWTLLAAVTGVWKLGAVKLTPEKEFIEGMDRDHRQLFEFELLLLLIMNTGLPEDVFAQIAAACGADKEQQQMIAKFMKALVLMLALLTYSDTVKKKLQTLVLDFKEQLLEGLTDIQQVLNRGSVDNGTSIRVFIQQAIAGLQEEDFDAVYGVYEAALEEIESTPAIINEELSEIIQAAKVVSNAFMQGSGSLSTALQVI